MDLRDIQHKRTDAIGHNYKGIPIFAAYGIHEKAYDLILKKNIEKDEPILVLGSGAGAFDQRLLDNGYTNITSVEFVEGSHVVSGVTLHNLDLNKDFSTLGTFKVIIALEIIEHLENQFHFIREIKKLMKDEHSILILSTPNIENDFSRIKYAFSGILNFFGPLELIGTGHISPIFDHILRFNLSQVDLAVEKKISNCNIWFDALFTYPVFRIRIQYFMLYLISRVLPKKESGQINIYLISQTHK
jgi:hypothetical protein